MSSPTKTNDVCGLCEKQYDKGKKNKNNLFVRDIKQDFAIPLEELTGPLSLDELKSICNKCKVTLTSYARHKVEYERLGSMIKSMATEHAGPRFKQCADISPTGRQMEGTSHTGHDSPARRDVPSEPAVDSLANQSGTCRSILPRPTLSTLPSVGVVRKSTVANLPVTSQSVQLNTTTIPQPLPTGMMPSNVGVVRQSTLAPVFWSAQTLQSTVANLPVTNQSVQLNTTTIPQPLPTGMMPSNEGVVRQTTLAPVFWSAQTLQLLSSGMMPSNERAVGRTTVAPALPTVMHSFDSQTGTSVTRHTIPPGISETTPMNQELHDNASSKPTCKRIPKQTYKVVLTTSQSRKTRNITGPLEKVVSNLVRGTFHRIPRAVMAVPGLSDLMVEEVLKVVNKECKKLTSVKFNSILRQNTLKGLKDFKWADTVEEWASHAPTFLKFLECASATSDVALRRGSNGMTNKWKMSMAGATLLNARCIKISAHMYRNTMVLRHGGAKRRCIQRLARLGICLSDTSALTKLKDFDTWKENDESRGASRRAGTERRRQRGATGVDCRDHTSPLTSASPTCSESSSFDLPPCEPLKSNNEEQREVPSEEGCSGITFDVSEINFAADKESNCSDKGHDDEEEEEEEMEEEHAFSDWQSDEFEEVDWDSDSDFELPVKFRRLCPDCGAFFYTSKPHTCEYKIKPYSCNVCGKRCVDERALQSHIRIHKEDYKHFCKFCLASFQTRLGKLSHEKTHASDGRPYQCPDCSLTFSKINERNLHLKDHRGVKIFSCPHCDLEFTSIRTLKRHVVVHTGVKPFVCEVCSRSFNQAGQLKSHMRLHTGEKPFQCQHCGKSFNHNVSLKSHVMRYHSGASDSESNRHIENVERSVAGEDQMRIKEESSGDDGNMSDDHTDQAREVSPLEKGPMKEVKIKSYRRSSGRPKGRPKSNAALGDMSLVPAVSGEAQDPSTAAETLKAGRLKRTRPKDIESNESDGDSTLELSGEDEWEGSKQVRKSKVKACKRPKNFDYEDYDSDSDFVPSEEMRAGQGFKAWSAQGEIEEVSIC